MEVRKNDCVVMECNVIIDADEDEDGRSYDMEIQVCPVCKMKYRFFVPERCVRCGQPIKRGWR